MDVQPAPLNEDDSSVRAPRRRASQGVCLPHLKLVLGQIKDGSACESLLAIQGAKLESLKDELAEFIRKNDQQAMKDGFGSEGDAWRRAIGMITGSRKDK